MTGQTFAEHLKAYLVDHKIPTSACSVIQANPARSKHLETATMTIHGYPMDFVNLRRESYATDSRIPLSTPFGSALEDAERRDITINSLFYNLSYPEYENPSVPWTRENIEDLQTEFSGQNNEVNSIKNGSSETRDLKSKSLNSHIINEDAVLDIDDTKMARPFRMGPVEDFCGTGIDDLSRKLIRTPLPPLETLLDDPLRVLRVIRFAARFNFDIEPGLLEALGNRMVATAFRRKISRERVLKEVDKIFSDPNGDGFKGLRLMHLTRVHALVFDPRVIDRDSVCEYANGSVSDVAFLLRPSNSSSDLSFQSISDASSESMEALMDIFEMRVKTMTVSEGRLYPNLTGKDANFPPDNSSESIESMHAKINDESGKFDELNHVTGLKNKKMIRGISQRLLLYGTALLPYCGLMVQRVRTKKEESLPVAIVRDALKGSCSDASDVASLLEPVKMQTILDLAKGLFFDNPDKEARLIGSTVRAIGSDWVTGFNLAMFWHLSGLDLCMDEVAISTEDYRNRAFRSIDNLVEKVFQKKLAYSYDLRPILSGNDIQSLLGRHPGKKMGAMLEDLIMWQFVNPLAGKAEATEYFMSTQSS